MHQQEEKKTNIWRISRPNINGQGGDPIRDFYVEARGFQTLAEMRPDESGTTGDSDLEVLQVDPDSKLAKRRPSISHAKDKTFANLENSNWRCNILRNWMMALWRLKNKRRTEEGTCEDDSF